MHSGWWTPAFDRASAKPRLCYPSQLGFGHVAATGFPLAGGVQTFIWTAIDGHGHNGWGSVATRAVLVELRLHPWAPGTGHPGEDTERQKQTGGATTRRVPGTRTLHQPSTSLLSSLPVCRFSWTGLAESSSRGVCY
eukprot:383682-Rhodomonas_salina.3